VSRARKLATYPSPPPPGVTGVLSSGQVEAIAADA